MTEPTFRRDLFHGTARAYDEFRPPYPSELITDLTARAGADGTGKVLDLACGTGQVSFALCEGFAEIWAVDQEPDMIEVARRRAERAGLAERFHFLACAAEELAAPDRHFDLVTVGNAFHRVRRDQVAHAILGWLRPGGYLALLWGGAPWFGDAPWQQALAATMDRWRRRLPDQGPNTASFEAARGARPDRQILADAGFDFVGRYSFAVTQLWTADELAGFLASTAALSAAMLADHAAEFDAELRAALQASQPDGGFSQDTVIAYDLARRPT
jgi:SAM-dependent methyltransferase